MLQRQIREKTVAGCEHCSVDQASWTKFKQLDRYYVDWHTGENVAYNGVYEKFKEHVTYWVRHLLSQDKCHAMQWKLNGVEKYMYLTYYPRTKMCKIDFGGKMWREFFNNKEMDAEFQGQFHLNRLNSAIIEGQIARNSVEKEEKKWGKQFWDWSSLLGENEQTTKELADMRKQNLEMRRINKLQDDKMIEDRQSSQARVTKAQGEVAQMEKKVHECTEREKRLSQLMSSKAIEERTGLQTLISTVRETSRNNLDAMQRTWITQRKMIDQEIKSEKEKVKRLKIENQRQKDKIAEECKKSEQKYIAREEKMKIAHQQEKDTWVKEVQSLKGNTRSMESQSGEDLRKRQAELQKENTRILADFQSKEKVFQSEKKEHIEVMKKAHERINELEEQNQHLMEGCTQLRSENDDLEEVVQNQRMRQREQQCQMNAVNERLRQTEEEKGSLKSDVSASNALNDQYRQRIGELETHRATADEDRIELEELRDRAESQENLREDHQRELDERQQAVFDAKEKLRQNVEEHDHWMMMAAYIGGGIVVVIGFVVFVLSRRTYNKMSDDMMHELKVQRKIERKYHEPLPVIPSAHANRLGVHEHPAVRDVFGMKEPWNVTPGNGVCVSRVTGGHKSTRETYTRELTALQDGEARREVQADQEHLSAMVGLPPPPPHAAKALGMDTFPDAPNESAKSVDEADEDQQVVDAEFFETLNI